MKITTTESAGLKRGVTLIELSVAIVVLLAFLGMTFIGVQSWKRGADRAGCVVNIRTVQQSVRAYANFNGIEAGEVSTGLYGEIVGAGRFLDESPTCPGQGTYSNLGSQVPQVGTLYLACSLKDSEKHQPDFTEGW